MSGDSTASASIIDVGNIRDTITVSLGDDRLNGIGPDDPLVRSGIISSLELVVVVLGLSDHFAVDIPDSVVTIDNFDTLSTLARRLAKLKQSQVPAGLQSDDDTWTFPLSSLFRALRRPVTLVFLVVVFLVFLDVVLMAVMKGPLADSYRVFLENGERLYPVSGGYSTDDLLFSVSQHKIARSSGARFPRVAVLGDSGTIGSWVTFDEAIPAIDAAKRRGRGHR